MKYNAKKIATELNLTALGKAHYGNALRVALDIPGVTAKERALLNRYATGANKGTDHVALQDLANRIWKGINVKTCMFCSRPLIQKDPKKHFCTMRCAASYGIAVANQVTRAIRK